MTRYLITGGAGFIGSHLADALLSKGHQVTALDDLSTGSPHNVEHLRANPNFHLVVDSVMNRVQTKELIDGTDYVFHLAAVVGVQRVMDSPARTIETNVGATEIVLDLACRARKTVLLSSTSEVYGKSTQLPFNEEGDLVMGATSRGRWSYACSKALDEFLALGYHHERHLPIVIVRLFNTVGPRQSSRYGMVLPRFVERALEGGPITVYGDGSQRRCFAYVGDVVWALARLIDTPDAMGKVYNVGSTEEISILELAKFVKNTLKSSSEIVFVPFDEVYDETFEDMQYRIPDLSRIIQAIGYEPRTRLPEIVDRVARFYRERM